MIFGKRKLFVGLIWEKTFIITALSPINRKCTHTQCTFEGRIWTITPRLKCSGFCMNKPFLKLKQIVFICRLIKLLHSMDCWPVGAGGRSGSVSVVSPVKTATFETTSVGICSLNCVSPQPELQAGFLSVPFHFSKQLPSKLPPPTRTCYTFANCSGFIS